MCAALGFVIVLTTGAAQQHPDWAEQVRSLAQAGKLAEAARVVDDWLAAAPADNDGRAWHARIAAWQGRYADAESEFVAMLRRSPGDVDLMLGLASVLNARDLPGRALPLLERACPDAAARPDCGIQKARTLFATGRTAEARNVCLTLSGVPSVSADCRKLTAEMREGGRVRVTIGAGTDRMNFTGDSVMYSQAFGVRLSRRWDAEAGFTQLARFGQTVKEADVAVTFKPARKTAITAGVGAAGRQDLAPRSRARIALDHGFTVAQSGPVRAIEAIYEQGTVSYSTARLLTFSPGVVVYLPRDWDCFLQAVSTRLRSPAAPPDWTLSGLARVSFPVTGRWRASLMGGTGSENFGTLEKLLFRSSETAGAGVAVKLGAGRQLRLGMRYQRIDGGRSIMGYESAFTIRL